MAQAQRFARLLSQVARGVTARQVSDVCCGDLTLVQFQTLQAVSGSDELSLGLLSARLRVDLSTMSRNVTVLERGSYLARARSADDGRVVHVRLTPKGKRALETLRCGERDVLRDVYERLSPADRPGVVRALESLQACLTEENASQPGCCSPDAVGRSAAG